MRTKIIILSAIFYLLLSMIFSSNILARQIETDTLRFQNNPNYKLQTGYYDVYQTKQADIVMLGNSLTNGANWNELLNRQNVVERGIPSDIVEGYLHRMEYIYKLKPKICFVMGGVNDIFSWIPVDEVFQNYVKVVNGLRARNIRVVIQSTLLAGADWGKEWISANRPDLNVKEYNAERNRQIAKLNQKLSLFAKQNKIDFIDLNLPMTRFMFLKKDLTWDGLHLNGNGYKIWGNAVDRVLRKYGF